MARRKAKPRRRALWLRVLLLGLLAFGAAAALRKGLVPPRFNPLPEIDLARRGGLLVDWQLAGLGRFPSACAHVLRSPALDARQIADRPIRNGCGWSNGVRLSSAGGARASFARITCETAVALAWWIEQEVQPLAREHLDGRVASVWSRGSYACRNIVGTAGRSKRRSQHAYANAADIAGFTLADGRRISIRTHWDGDTPRGRFLRQVHARACRYFRVALGPDYNAAHRDHFHLDRGPASACR